MTLHFSPKTSMNMEHDSDTEGSAETWEGEDSVAQDFRRRLKLIGGRNAAILHPGVMHGGCELLPRKAEK